LNKVCDFDVDNFDVDVFDIKNFDIIALQELEILDYLEKDNDNEEDKDDSFNYLFNNLTDDLTNNAAVNIFSLSSARSCFSSFVRLLTST
jgi:hypothetical protein